MNRLADLLERQTDRFGSQLALQYRPRYRMIRWSYRELSEQSRQLARQLEQAGIQAGDRLLLRSENSPFWVAAFFASARQGSVLIPLNPGTPRDQIERIRAATRPRLLLCSQRHAEPLPGLPMRVLDEPASTASRLAPDAHPPQPSDLAEILYTSGTTGQPKGVMLTADNLMADMSALSQAAPLSPDDHALNLVPFFHAYGQMTGILCPLLGGCPVTHVTRPTSRTLQEALSLTPATHLILVPEILKTLMDRLEQQMGRIPGFMTLPLRRLIRKRLSPTLHTFICGGAPLDPLLEEKCRDLGFEILQGYGLTETSPVITANTPTAHRTGSVGRPLSGVELKRTDQGELLVRGPMVSPGYFEQPELTREAFRSGWFHTGDIGHFDADGYLYLLGRRRYLIIGPGGENVFPEDLEAELNRQPGILDSAVVGLEEGGRMVIHAVLSGEFADGQVLVEQVNRRLAPHQQIMTWSVWPEADFPRTATHKIRKERVIAWLKRAPTPTREAELPLTKGTSPLRRLLAQVSGLPVSALGGETRILSGLRIDSMLRIELVSRLEESLGVCIEEREITPALTIAELEERVRERRQTAGSGIAHYPRWSLARGVCRIRPIASRLLLESWIRGFCRLQIEGLEKLSGLDEPTLFMANHRSYLDAALVSFALPDRFRWRLTVAAATAVLYRKYRWAVPLGELTLNAFPFPTEVNESIRSGFDLVGKLLDDGWSVLLFPEGQMNRSRETLLELKPGAGVAAIEMGAPIVPVTLQGSDRILPPGRLLPRHRGTVTLRFGSPLRFGPGTPYLEAERQIEAALKGQLRPLEKIV